MMIQFARRGSGRSAPTLSHAPVVEELESRALLSASAATVPTQSAFRPVSPVRSVAAASTSGHVPLGGNLNFQNDRVQDHPFVDLVKATRGFYNASGGLSSTDGNGWPTQDFSFSAADNSEYGVAIAAGVYKLSFTGPAATTVAWSPSAPGPRSAPSVVNLGSQPAVKVTKTGYTAATGLTTYDVTVPSGVYTLALTFTHSGGGVKNIRLLQPGYSAASAPVYTSAYLNLLKTLGPDVTRFMDFTRTNNSTLANWSDRSHVTDASYWQKGVPWEDVILLANTLHKGVWVNLPAHATDDYVTHLANLLRTTLASDLPIYVEYSNEVWNSSFEAYRFNLSQAGAEVVAAARAGKLTDLNYDHLKVDTSQPTGGANIGTWADRRYARRVKQISDLFRAAWVSAHQGSPINGRVRVILGGQAANLGRFDNELKYLSAIYGAPSTYLYGLAIAPYVNLGQYADSSGDSHVTEAQVIAGLTSSLAGYQSKGVFPAAVAKAKVYGLKLEAYEGGFDTYGSLNVASKAAAMHDPKIESLMTQYLNLWYRSGGDQFNWYTLGARSYSTLFGSWSITDTINNYTEPKELGFIAVRNEAPPK